VQSIAAFSGELAAGVLLPAAAGRNVKAPLGPDSPVSSSLKAILCRSMAGQVRVWRPVDNLTDHTS
jgi:hypothetical protein